MTATANGYSQRSSSILVRATVRLRHDRSHILVEATRCACAALAGAGSEITGELVRFEPGPTR